MTSLLEVDAIIEATLLLALLILAIAAFRAKRSLAFLLLMLATICFFVWHFAPFAIALFCAIRGWKPPVMDGWMHSWGFSIFKILYFVFLTLMIAAFVLFVQERRRVDTPPA